MEEIKPTEFESGNMVSDNKPRSLMDEMKELKEFKQQFEASQVKTKKIKVPRKAKVKGRKIKQGYIGILKLDENRNLSAEKQKVGGNVYMDNKGIYHATDGSEIVFWEGRYPMVIQPSWKNNPLRFDPKNDKNETYGQPYIKAKMLADTIKVKTKANGSIILWIVLAGAALFAINYFLGGGNPLG